MRRSMWLGPVESFLAKARGRNVVNRCAGLVSFPPYGGRLFIDPGGQFKADLAPPPDQHRN
jgi:hypothetical protein